MNADREAFSCYTIRMSIGWWKIRQLRRCVTRQMTLYFDRLAQTWGTLIQHIPLWQGLHTILKAMKADQLRPWPTMDHDKASHVRIHGTYSKDDGFPSRQATDGIRICVRPQIILRRTLVHDTKGFLVRRGKGDFSLLGKDMCPLQTLSFEEHLTAASDSSEWVGYIAIQLWVWIQNIGWPGKVWTAKNELCIRISGPLISAIERKRSSRKRSVLDGTPNICSIGKGIR